MVYDDLHFEYDTDTDVYSLAYTHSAAPQYLPDTVLKILETDGWTVENTETGFPVNISYSDPDMSGTIGNDLELTLDVRLSPLKQYEMEHILRGGDSDDTVAELVVAERDSNSSLIYDY